MMPAHEWRHKSSQVKSSSSKSDLTRLRATCRHEQCASPVFALRAHPGTVAIRAMLNDSRTRSPTTDIETLEIKVHHLSPAARYIIHPRAAAEVHPMECTWPLVVGTNGRASMEGVSGHLLPRRPSCGKSPAVQHCNAPPPPLALTRPLWRGAPMSALW